MQPPQDDFACRLDYPPQQPRYQQQQQQQGFNRQPSYDQQQGQGFQRRPSFGQDQGYNGRPGPGPDFAQRQRQAQELGPPRKRRQFSVRARTLLAVVGLSYPRHFWCLQSARCQMLPVSKKRQPCSH